VSRDRSGQGRADAVSTARKRRQAAIQLWIC